MSLQTQKTPLRHVIVSQRGIKNSNKYTLDLGFVTYDGRYAEYELQIRQKAITKNVLDRFHQLFSEWQLTPDTDINVMGPISFDNPFIIYLEIIAQQVEVPVKQLSIEKITNRFKSLYPKWYGKWTKRPDGGMKLELRMKTVNSRLAALWKGFVQTGICPWINQRVDDFLKTKDSNFRMRKKIVRVAAWYLVWRFHVLETSRRCVAKKLETQNLFKN